jgi:4-hydroxybenzoate polyprenyltransferase
MSRLPDYARLVRLPNLPSALADICLGALAARALPGGWLAFLLLLPASACLYMAGMVWNDYFDLEQDRKERPSRPLPSGRVTPAEAARLGSGLMAVGVLFAALAGLARRGASSVTPPLLAVLIVAAVFAYDGWLKRTPLGPVAMGLCRFLNVLLGLSAGPGDVWAGAPLALAVGLYVAGVTWFARTEARQSNVAHLRGAAGVMLAGLALGLTLPSLLEGRGIEVAPSHLFVPLLVGFGFLIGLPISLALASPTSTRVQTAVTRCLLGLVLLDAVLASGLVGEAGLAVALLVLPGVYLRRRAGLYAT